MRNLNYIVEAFRDAHHYLEFEHRRFVPGKRRTDNGLAYARESGPTPEIPRRKFSHQTYGTRAFVHMFGPALLEAVLVRETLLYAA